MAFGPLGASEPLIIKRVEKVRLLVALVLLPKGDGWSVGENDSLLSVFPAERFSLVSLIFLITAIMRPG